MTTDDRRHEPFPPSNREAEVHGARSERRVAPLAAEIEQQARADASWPDYLRDPAYGPAVSAWCRSEATVRLLWTWIGEQDLTTWLTDTSTEETTECHGKGGSSRTTTAKRQGSALEALRKAETLAAARRRDLGLDPTSRARFAKDRAVTTAVANRLHDLAATGAGLVAAAHERGVLSCSEDHEVPPMGGTDEGDGVGSMGPTDTEETDRGDQ